MQPVVTSVIPVFNREKWLSQAIYSVVEQDYSNKRIVIVDDSSKDNSWQKIKYCFDKYENVSVPEDNEPSELIRGTIKKIPAIAGRFKNNYGPSFSRNFCFKCGWEGTDYFALLDSDDWYEQGKISKSVQIAEENGLGLVYTDYYTIDPIKNTKVRIFKEPYVRRRLLDECIVASNFIVKKKALEDCGLFDERLLVCEDWDLECRISCKYIIGHISEPLVNMRVGEHSSSVTRNQDVWQQCWRYVFDRNQTIR